FIYLTNNQLANCGISLNRFHIGGHVGLDAHYDRFVFGFSYGGDFTKIVNPKFKVSSFKFRVGINF
ncbi:MAG: hypothetical protein ACI4BH_00365, partial [Muribaculaceae bacterium]